MRESLGNDEEKINEINKLIIFDTYKAANIVIAYREDRFERIYNIWKKYMILKLKYQNQKDL